jgi:hypothetical protein
MCNISQFFERNHKPLVYLFYLVIARRAIDGSNYLNIREYDHDELRTCVGELEMHA